MVKTRKTGYRSDGQQQGWQVKLQGRGSMASHREQENEMHKGTSRVRCRDGAIGKFTFSGDPDWVGVVMDGGLGLDLTLTRLGRVEVYDFLFGWDAELCVVIGIRNLNGSVMDGPGSFPLPSAGLSRGKGCLLSPKIWGWASSLRLFVNIPLISVDESAKQKQ
ncbi:hypothetical protein FA15DRAFT_657789 [Coprinopsis marcescibilis]|uniref:Uncharacterized protein n=1 Tax=Coprinopsis marcescibilis TaxID=230819 RepID=A0A5C3KNP9_COPMA|nr:hypothetical protein FA15DRAFT_657789 [Coprinopsis marcescibilis]